MSATLREELTGFTRFVEEQLGESEGGLSLEQSLHAYREYQEELTRFLVGLEESRDQVRRGDIEPLNPAAVKARVRARLAQDGITD